MDVLFPLIVARRASHRLFGAPDFTHYRLPVGNQFDDTPVDFRQAGAKVFQCHRQPTFPRIRNKPDVLPHSGRNAKLAAAARTEVLAS